MPCKTLHMKKIICLPCIILFIALPLWLTIAGCSKSVVEEKQLTFAQQQFEENILNKNFRVHLATDNGADLTPQYTGYTFVMLKTTYYNGPMTGVKNGVTYNGTWSSNEDYSKLSINFSTAPPEFVFLNREWRFTRKALPVMELAPWGNLEPKILHMERF